MNSKLLSVLSVAVIALIATAPLSQAKTYTPAQFNTELKKQVGTKKGAAAYNKIAAFYSSVLKDKKNKNNAAKYVTSMAKIMKDQKVISLSLQGKSVNTVILKMLPSYFQGIPFDINNKVYNQAVTALINTLASTQKLSQANTDMFYKTIKNYAVGKKKQPQLTIYNYYLSLAKKTNVKPPTTS